MSNERCVSTTSLLIYYLCSGDFSLIDNILPFSRVLLKAVHNITDQPPAPILCLFKSYFVTFLWEGNSDHFTTGLVIKLLDYRCSIEEVDGQSDRHSVYPPEDTYHRRQKVLSQSQ